MWAREDGRARAVRGLLHASAARPETLCGPARGGARARRPPLPSVRRARTAEGLACRASPGTGPLGAGAADLALPGLPCQGDAHTRHGQGLAAFAGCAVARAAPYRA